MFAAVMAGCRKLARLVIAARAASLSRFLNPNTVSVSVTMTVRLGTVVGAVIVRVVMADGKTVLLEISSFQYQAKFSPYVLVVLYAIQVVVGVKPIKCSQKLVASYAMPELEKRALKTSSSVQIS